MSGRHRSGRHRRSPVAGLADRVYFTVAGLVSVAVLMAFNFGVCFILVTELRAAL